MDVFGTVTTTIHLINKVVGYLQAIRGAEEDRLKLLSETSALGAVLDILHRRLGKSDSNDDSISNRLVKAGIGGPLDQYCRTLESAIAELEHIAGAGESSSFAKKMRNLRWPFRKEEIRSILDKIGRLKSLISLALQTSLMEFIENTREALVVVGLNVERIENAVSALEEHQRAQMKEIESRYINLQDLGFSLRDSANDIAIVKDMVAIINRNQQDQSMKGDRMQADLTIIKGAVDGQELQDLVKWLSPLDFSEKHSTIFEKHAPGTGEWLLKHPKFLAWTRGEFKTLWCPGNPGVGKSVMASLIIHELGEAISKDTALVFIYFEYKTKYTTIQLAEAILKQLVQQQMSQSSLESLRKHKAGNRPTLTELLGMLKVEVETYSRVLIVTDALDEADVWVWAPLLKHLQALSRISLLVTSRDTGDVAHELRPDQCLDIMANDGDMRRYIEGRLSGSTGRFKRLLEANMDSDLREEIITGVVKKADGMFLLAQLHMNSLEEVSRVSDLRLALSKLPEDLETTYDETLERINNKDRPLAYQIFSWLIYAAQPMTMRDLQYALAVEDGMTAIDTRNLHDEATLTSICVGLVVLRENASSQLTEVDNSQTNSKVVGLVHYTTQEYFLHSRNISTQLANSAHFAITCLQFLAFDIFQKTNGSLKGIRKQLVETPFAEYAMLSWGVHARTYCGNTTVRCLAMKLLYDAQKVALIGFLLFQTRNLSPIHLCAHFGLRDYLEYLLDNGFDINSKDSDGDTAIMYAAIYNQEETLQLLLARGGVGVALRGWNGATPLTRAAACGYQGIVALLLAHGGVEINWQDHDGKTAIARATESGDSGIVELLVRDVDVNLPDEDGATPLALAVIEGHEAIVQLLLTRDDANVNSRDNIGVTPIILAAWKGHSDIVKLLLARDDVDINLQDEDGNTPLTLAVVEGHEAIVRLLLTRNSANVNSRDNVGNTPIILAAWKGHSDIAEILLARDDVNINLQDEDGNTPLALAVIEGHEAIARLLLIRNDTNVNSRNSIGNTPMIPAARKGHIDIVKLLLARDDVDINLRGECGYTPLTHAIFEGHGAIIQLLLERDDLDANLKDDDGHTYLIAAALSGNEGVVKWWLAKSNIDINSKNVEGQVALHCAASMGHEAVVKLLLAQEGIDVNHLNSYGRTPLDRAETRKHQGVIELLREAGGRMAAELEAEHVESVAREEGAGEKGNSSEEEAWSSHE